MSEEKDEFPDTLTFLGRIRSFCPEVESLVTTTQLKCLDLNIRYTDIVLL